ncbi:hypothetical protein THAOC_14970, partial [Thalassiosira oceanica]
MVRLALPYTLLCLCLNVAFDLLVFAVELDDDDTLEIRRYLPQSRSYIDVEDLDTAAALDAMERLTVRRFRLSSDQGRHCANSVCPFRTSSTDLASALPTAVDFVHAPSSKEGDGDTSHLIVQNNEAVFYHSVGAVQELSKQFSELVNATDYNARRIAELYADWLQLEMITSTSLSNTTKLALRRKAAEAAIEKSNMEMELLRSRSEKEYAQVQEQLEAEQLAKSERMALDRLKREDEASKRRTAELMRAKFEASQRIAAHRSHTAEAIARVEHEQKMILQRAAEEVKVKTAIATARARAQAERENEDVHLRRLRAESEQRRQRNLSAIQAIFTHLSSSLSSAAKNPRQVATLCGYVCLLLGSVFFSRETSRLIRALIEASLGKPQLVRETTRKTFPWSLFSFASRSASRFCPFFRGELISVESSFDDLVLPSELKERVIELAQSTRNARRLLYGSPGTGKTMVARKLAKVCGLDYALMSGGDVSPLGSDAVSQIHSLFSWARMSPVGVVLFIDEAECFLGSRDSGFTSEAAHNALNALLYNTGGERRDFMMILATNRAQDLDAAVLDRCDEALHFPLPDETCRERLLRLYYNQNLEAFVRKNNKQVLSLRSRLTRLITKGDSPLIMSIDSDIMKSEHL